MTILVRVTKIAIGYDAVNKYDWEHIKKIEWNDSDPWVVLPVPAGSNIYQQIRPILIEGTITCVDPDLVHVALFATDIAVEGGNQYAIDPSTFVRQKIEYFVVYAKDKAGATVTYTFANVRIKTLDVENLVESAGEPRIKVGFYADSVTKST